MKQEIFYIAILTFFFSFNSKAQPGQISLTIQQESNPSLFLQDHWKILFHFNPADSIYIDRNKCCTVEFQLPEKEWEKLRPYFTVEDECEGCYILLDTLDRKENVYRVSIVATDSSTLRQLEMGPVAILFRYRINAIQNNAPLTLYSNVDTMYLSPAIPDDIEAINFLSSTGWNALQFVHFYTLGVSQNYDKIAHVRDSFPDSLLSEFADFALLDYELLFDNRNTSLTAEKILWYKTQFQSFLNSASPDLRKFASWKLADPLFNQ